MERKILILVLLVIAVLVLPTSCYFAFGDGLPTGDNVDTVSDPVITDYGAYSGTQHVIGIRCSTDSAQIVYQIDDGSAYYYSSRCDEYYVGGAYRTGILVNVGSTVYAQAKRSGLNDSNVVYLVISNPKTATPVLVDYGVYYSDSSKHVIGMTCSTSGATIRYTTDGSTPTSNSSYYSGSSYRTTDGEYHTGVLVLGGSTVRARAFTSGYDASDVSERTVSASRTATPVIVNYGTSYSYPSYFVVGISCSTPGATIRYTTNGSTPTSSSTTYSNDRCYTTTGGEYYYGILVPVGSTVKAIATAAGYTSSLVETLDTYIGTAATPVITDCGDSLSSSYRVVTISCSTTGADIRYTTDGSTPTSSSTLYLPSSRYTSDLSVYNGIVVPAGSTVKAMAFASNLNNSSVFSITTKSGTVDAPTIIDYGVYSGNTSKHVIGISCSTSGATIRYTTNGSTPTSSSSSYSPGSYETTAGVVYSGILVSEGSTIRSIGIKSGYDNSNIANYTVPSSGGGSLYSVSNVSGYYNWTTMTSPATGSYAAYKSTNQGLDSTYSVMKVTFNKSATAFSFYIRSNAESTYDYVLVSQKNSTYVPTARGDFDCYAHTSGIQNSGTSVDSYSLVTINGLNAGDYFYVVYRKDNSEASGDDTGYVLFPK